MGIFFRNIVLALFVISFSLTTVSQETAAWNIEANELLNTALSDTFPPPPQPANKLAPGTARVRAEIIKLDSSSTDFILEIRILKTLGYGAATPLLESNQELKVRSTSFLKQATDNTKKRIKTGQKAVLYLQHIQQMELYESAADWSLIEIEKPQNCQKN